VLYDIKLTATSSYARSAAGGRHLLRLMPSGNATDRQRLISSALDIQPTPRERLEATDFFGNQTTEIIFGNSHDEAEFTVRARVARRAQPIGTDVSPKLEALPGELDMMRGLDALSPWHFIGTSPMIAPSAAIAAYARAAMRADMSIVEAARTLNLALHRDIRYDGDATTVETPLEEAFAARKGVCQDFSHIMIACLREAGIPAGYVSGFLRTEPPKGKPRLEGADAMHAWVQVWCGREMGWIEFDPTNALIVEVDHIVVARGRDYSDVAPIKGVLWTSGEQKTDQAVDVIPLE
jgi:transglutaminase-like putative cysteine protease